MPGAYTVVVARPKREGGGFRKLGAFKTKQEAMEDARIMRQTGFPGRLSVVKTTDLTPAKRGNVMKKTMTTPKKKMKRKVSRPMSVEERLRRIL